MARNPNEKPTSLILSCTGFQELRYDNNIEIIV